MARKPSTVLEFCVARLGVHRGALAAANVAQWAIAAHELGHVPTTVEYAEYWAITERSGWHHRARVREAFGEDWPQVVTAVAERIESHAPSVVMRLSVPRALAV